MNNPWQRRGAGQGRETATASAPEMRSPRPRELRLYGANAVRAMFARRPEALRKLYLSGARAAQFADVMKWCAAQRIGYRLVEDDDLARLAASGHHEGVVADVLPPAMPALHEWLPSLPAGPACLLWLDGVGNPHNLGTILRNAAHFGVAALLIPATSRLQLSGAAARVAEGGAEAVPLVRLPPNAEALAALRAAGFSLLGTRVAGGESLFAQALPERLVYVLGAEQSGMDRALLEACDRQLSIPGSGQVESLNVASATAVLLASWANTHGMSGT